jgi:Na+/phosphate symporter
MESILQAGSIRAANTGRWIMNGAGRPQAQPADRAEIVAMGDEVVEMLRLVREAFVKMNLRPMDQASQIARQVHQQEHGFIARLAARPVATGATAPGLAEEVAFVPMHLERIAGNIESLAASITKMVRDGTLFTDRARGEVGSLFSAAVELLEALRDALRTGNGTLVRYVIDAGLACEARANEYGLFHEQRLIEGVCQPRASSVYLAMLDHIKGIEWHARQIAEKLQRAPIGVERPDRDAERTRRAHA